MSERLYCAGRRKGIFARHILTSRAGEATTPGHWNLTSRDEAGLRVLARRRVHEPVRPTLASPGTD